MIKHDVVIIGAGIGGLICGTLLAKAGLKVLILEKNSNVGGYCSTFRVKEFRFDSFVHSFGNLSKGSHLNSLLSEIGIIEDLEIIRINPSDVIYSPGHLLEFGQSIEEIISTLISQFPSEEYGINAFFRKLILLENLDSISTFRNISFRKFLDKIFESEELKQILSLVILGNLGTPPRDICCFTAIKHYRQFIIDGGYYTNGGVDAIPIALLNKFKSIGGEILLSRPATKILVDNHGAHGVEANDGKVYPAKYVVSDCDMRSTLFDLIGKDYLAEPTVKYVESLVPSLSLIVIYLGLEKCLNLKDKVNNWFINDYQYDSEIGLNPNYNIDNLPWFMLRTNHDEKTCVIYASAPAKNDTYWRDNRRQIAENILTKVETHVPGLKKKIVFQTIADPSILNRWTSNYAGAAYGWASTVEQFMAHDFLRDNIIANLYFCGHWSTVGQGIPGVAIAAQRIAHIIRRKFVE